MCSTAAVNSLRLYGTSSISCFKAVLPNIRGEAAASRGSESVSTCFMTSSRIVQRRCIVSACCCNCGACLARFAAGGLAVSDIARPMRCSISRTVCKLLSTGCWSPTPTSAASCMSSDTKLSLAFPFLLWAIIAAGYSLRLIPRSTSAAYGWKPLASNKFTSRTLYPQFSKWLSSAVTLSVVILIKNPLIQKLLSQIFLYKIWCYVTMRSTKHIYPSTELSPEARTVVARIYGAWKRRNGQRDDYVMLLSEAGITVSPRSLDRWCTTLDKERIFLSGECSVGRPKALDEEKLQLLTGFVLDKNSKNEVVHLATVVNFAQEEFGIHISNTTALNYLHDSGFSSRAVQSRTLGFKIDDENLSHLAFGWLQRAWRQGLWDSPRSKICSIDFTFTGHRMERDVTFTVLGSPQPKSSKSSPTASSRPCGQME